MAASPDGKILALADSPGRGRKSSVTLWDVANWKELRTLSVFGAPRCMAFSSDGKTIGLCNYKTVQYWNVSSGKEERTVSIATGGDRHLDFSPDLKQLASNNRQGEARLLDQASGKERVLHQEEGLESVAFSADSRTLLCTIRKPRGLPVLVDVATGKELRRLNVPTAVLGAVRRDGKAVALTLFRMSEDRVQFWDLEADRAGDSFPLGFRVSALAYTPDGRHLLLVGGRVGVYILRLAPPPGRAGE